MELPQNTKSASTDLIRSDAETGELREGEVIYLSDCPDEFRANFNSARKAIEKDVMGDLQAALKSMLQDSSIPGKHRLDVCIMVPGPKTSPWFCHPMTLLAFAGYHARDDMIKWLISQGARVDMDSKFAGTILLQLLKYSQIQQTPQQVSFNIVKFLIAGQQEILSRVLTAGTSENTTALELSLDLRRFDIARMLVEVGMDPIYGGDPEIRPIFLEYTQFGSNEFLRWLLEEHLTSEGIPAFVDRLLSGNIFLRSEDNHYAFEVLGRSFAHAFLLSGSEDAITCLVNKEPDLLKACDPFGKSALHLAAEKGDSESVRVLLAQECDAVVNTKDGSSMTPLMLATKNGHVEVIEVLLMKLLQLTTDSSGTINPMELWSWALQYGYPAYFEAMHQTKELEEFLISPLDNDENTIAHLAAKGGHISIFKSLFPLTFPMPLYEILKKKNKQKKTALQLAIEKGNIGILNALQERRADREKEASEHQSLHEQQNESAEIKEWNEFWDSESPGLMLYACLHGTVEIVKYFVTKFVSPTTRLNGKKRHTPLSCAAKAGNHEIVAYLLSIKGVSAEGVDAKEVSLLSVAADDQKSAPEDQKPYSPLMLASKCGHAKCVTLLLDKGADFQVKSERGYNCLMESIEAGHEDVAIAILTHPWEDGERWKDTMRWCAEKDGQMITPLRFLIERMPDVAKLVFTKCLTNDEGRVSQEQSKLENGHGMVKRVLYDFEFIENYNLPVNANQSIQLTSQSTFSRLGTSRPHSRYIEENDALWWLVDKEGRSEPDGGAEDEQYEQPRFGPKGYFSFYHSHPLTLMVKHERLKLLQHPLISRYIRHKWWRMAYFFLFYLLVYIVFLFLLTTFAVAVPRPGPDDNNCPTNHSGSTYDKLNFKENTCKEPDGVQKRSFAALAVIIALLSTLFLVFDIMFEIWVHFIMRERHTNLAVYEAVIRAAVFLLTIIFVFGFWNDCWCAPPWQWQIGALAVFLAYINILLLLKGMPILGVPINMFFNIVFTFLKLIYLPVLLIFSFAIPFYMLFVRDSNAVLDEDGPGILEAFSTPAHSMAKAILQTAGELDYETIFNEANLLYSPMAYILFISFVVLMPILFSNLLVGLAVGTTDEDTKKATFTNIQLQVDFLVGLESFDRFRRFRRLQYLEYKEKTNRNWIMSQWDKWQGLDYKSQKNVVEDLNSCTVDPDEESKEAVQTLKEKVTKMAVTLQEKIPVLERSHKQLQESLESNMQALQSNMNEILKKLGDK